MRPNKKCVTGFDIYGNVEFDILAIQKYNILEVRAVWDRLLYYVIQFGGLGRPPCPPCNIVIINRDPTGANTITSVFFGHGAVILYSRS